MIETQTRGKGTIDCGLRGSMGTLVDINPTRLSKQSQGCPLTMSSLLTTLIVSLLWCVKVNTLGTPCEEDLDQAYHPFEQFYLNYCTKFLYSLFNTFILDSSPQTL